MGIVSLASRFATPACQRFMIVDLADDPNEPFLEETFSSPEEAEEAISGFYTIEDDTFWLAGGNPRPKRLAVKRYETRLLAR